MKNILLILSLVILALTACKENPQEVARKQLAAVVSQVSVPHKVDSSTVLTGMSLDDKVLTSRIEIPAERLAKLQPDSLSATQVNQLSTNLTSRKLRDLAVKADVTLRYVYVSGNDSVVLVITPDALAK